MSQHLNEIEFGPDDDGNFNIEGSQNCSHKLFKQTLQVWIVLQQRKVSLNEAAATFMVSPDTIRRVLKNSLYRWIDDNDTLCQEGD